MNEQEQRLRAFAGQHRLERISFNKRRDAAVLIPLVLRDGRLQILFEVRNDGIRQGGEVCFPGGRIEKGELPEQAARRETAEELQIPEEKVEVLGPMHSHLGPGGAMVTSYLGILHGYSDTFRGEEVSRVFRIPLDWLLSYCPEIYHADMVIRPREDFPTELIEKDGKPYPWQSIVRNYYFYKTEHAVIWGVTAELLYHFLEAVAPCLV